jgi:hypothetical protein
MFLNGVTWSGGLIFPVLLAGAEPWRAVTVSRFGEPIACDATAGSDSSTAAIPGATADSAEIIEQRGGRYYQLGRPLWQHLCY